MQKKRRAEASRGRGTERTQTQRERDGDAEGGGHRPREREMVVQEGEDGSPEEGGRWVDRHSERVWGRKSEKARGEKKIVTE